MDKTNTGTVIGVIIVLLVALGLFWIYIGISQFGMSNSLVLAVANDPGTYSVTKMRILFASCILSFIFAILNLRSIKPVLMRYRTSASRINLLTTAGIVLSIIPVLADSTIQLLAIPVYIVISVLTGMVKGALVESTGKR